MHPFHPTSLFDLSNYRHAVLFADCVYAWQVLSQMGDYLAATTSNSADWQVPPGVHVVNPSSIYLGEGTLLEAGCWIQGPCILGAGCTVRQGAYIRGHVIAGDRCVIGHTTEIKQAVLLDDVHAAHFAYVGDSVLGNHVNLGAGVKCANLKFDGTAVYVNWQGERYATGRRKLGALIGDRTQIGCNAVTNPGTIIGQDVQWYPCVNRGGVIAAHSKVKT